MSPATRTLVGVGVGVGGAVAGLAAERRPDAELTVLPGAGHQLMQGRPEALARLIRALAARTAPRPAAVAGRGS
ncbi:MAG TPA: hypothetical protein VEW93_06140 [Acidimicrobiales bacterium]|nr:hypothetical protein [Acidimicrobiales bacterium]